MRVSVSTRGVGVAIAALVGAPIAAGDIGCGESTGSGLRRHPARVDAGVDASASSDGGSGNGGSGHGGSGTGGARTGGSPGSGGSIQNSCRDSRDCSENPDGRVICDRALRQCVQCVVPADCDPGMACLGDACRPPCTSDRQCTSLGLLCNRAAGLCVECLVDSDCDAARCISGVCRDVAGDAGAESGGAPSTGGGGGVPSGGGGTSSGGLSGTGGTVGSGGIATGGATSGGQGGATGGQLGGGGSNGCATNEKFCGGVCTTPSPATGCSLTGCAACPEPPPTNGVLACVGGACDFVCLSGFTKVGSACVSNQATGGATGSGGGGGTGGTGGSAGTGGGGTCVPASCPKCCFGTLAGCCKSDGACGCTPLCVPGGACQ